MAEIGKQGLIAYLSHNILSSVVVATNFSIPRIS